MIKSGYIEWANENEGRAYPLREEATQTDIAGRFLPTDILADAGLIVPYAHRDVYCSGIRLTSQLYSIAFTSAAGPLLVGTFAASAYQPYTAVALTPLAPDVSGWVVFGRHRVVVPEAYTFNSVASAGLEARAVRIIDAIPVRKLLKLGAPTSEYLDRLVTMVGTAGLAVRKSSGKLALSLDPKLSSLFRPVCPTGASAAACGLPPIRRINGVSADENGRITLRFVPADWEEPV